EEPVGEGQVLGETQPAHLVHGGTAPLHDRTYAVRLQVLAQPVAIANIDLVVLIDVEMLAWLIWSRRPAEIRQPLERRVVGSRDLSSARQRSWKIDELVVEESGLQIVEAAVRAPDRRRHVELLVAVRAMIAHP